MRFTTILLAYLTASAALANDSVQGQETLFLSPNGLEERCVQIAPIPGGDYSNGDLKDEAEYCEIDLYDASVALCPKTWSTSPGMMVYDISEGPYENDRAAFSRNACLE